MRYVVSLLVGMAIAIVACGGSGPDGGELSPTATATPPSTLSASPIERVDGFDHFGRYIYDTQTGNLYDAPAGDLNSFLGWSRDGLAWVTTSCCDGGTAFSKLDIATGAATTFGEIGGSVRYSSVSPDETMVAFRDESDDSLRLLRFGGSTLEEITTTVIGSGSWSWDSRFVAYFDGIRVVVWDVASAAERIIIPEARGASWEWSPTGSVLAYTTPGGVFVYNAETGITSTLVEGEAKGPLDWSPDGIRIVARYGEKTNIPIEGDTEVMRPAVIGLDGSVVQLPAARGVRWSPGGSQLVYLGFTTNRLEDQFHVFTLSTGEDVEISSISGVGKEALAWSPTGGTIAFADSWNAFLYDSSTGTATKIASLPGDSAMHFHGFDWSPDGRYLTTSIGGGHG